MYTVTVKYIVWDDYSNLGYLEIKTIAKNKICHNVLRFFFFFPPKQNWLLIIKGMKFLISKLLFPS